MMKSGLLPRVLILGRPNVGKSTLFNRLARKQLAIVHDMPGVTRDWQEAPAMLDRMEFIIMDSPGLDGFETQDLKDQIHVQTQELMRQAHLILFMIDGREGIVSSDEVLAQWLRESGKPHVLLSNKSEGKEGELASYGAYALGLGDPIAFSAAHGQGLAALHDAMMAQLREIFRAYRPEDQENPHQDFHEHGAEGEEMPEEDGPLRLAVLGRPNVGKSTLINKLIGENRLLTSDQPGVTRDSVDVAWSFDGHPITLVDTAGIRKKSKIHHSLEQASVRASFQAVRYAHCVILVLDALSPLDKQELLLAAHVLKEGRCLVLALNKWDQADKSILKNLEFKLSHVLSQAKGVPLVPISALKGTSLKKLIRSVIALHQVWNKRVPTAKLNQFLEEATQRHPPKLSGQGRIRLKYMTQVKARPPTFSLFTSKPTELPDSYVRYLLDGIRHVFGFHGVPLRLQLRKGKNPYV